jgi:hypothetical protein
MVATKVCFVAAFWEWEHGGRILTELNRELACHMERF